MEVYNGHICVTVAELTDSSETERIMTRKNYDALVNRKRLRVLRPGKGLGHPALVEWASIPERFKTKYVAKYGDPDRIIMEQSKTLTYDTLAEEYFSDKLAEEEGIILGSGKIKEYSINASVLNRLIGRIDTQRVSRNKCGNRTPIAWDGITAESERLRDEYGHTLPRSGSRLRDKIRQYRKEGYRCLVSGKLYNENSVKITAEAGRYLIALKCSFLPSYTNHQIWEKFNETAREKGWKALKSPSSVTQFLEKPEIKVQWYDAVHGELAAKKLYARQNVTILPTRRDSLWYGDGTKLNLYYKTYTPEGYKPATAWVFEVIDAYSECLIGYDIAASETFESMYEAYRMAIETTGHLPVELAYDGQGGTARDDAKEWLGKVARYSHRVSPHNPQSKTIESIFGRFQRQVLHKYFGYTGGNVTDKSESSKPNLEFIQENADRLPTYEELCGIYARAREEWNRMPHFKYGSRRIELYESSVNEESVTLTDTMRRELFWLTSRKECKFTARGLQITVDKRTYNYEVYGADGFPDMAFRRDNTGRDFFVQYDPHDMDTVRLCTKDKSGYRFVREAKPCVAIHRAMQDQTDGERSYIYELMRRDKMERIRRQQDNLSLRMEYGVAPEQHGFTTPRPKGVSKEEYERYSDIIRAEKSQSAEPEHDGILPATLGQVEKERSGLTFDKVSAYDRM